ncbi:MAG: hypothetical protein WDZ96_05875 [Acidimicrobiia bacterium]
MFDAPPEWLSKTWEYTGIAGGVTALVASIFFAFAVGPWVETLADSFEVTAEGLQALDNTLAVVDESLVVVSDTMVGIDGVFTQTNVALGDISTVVLSSGRLLQTEIPGQIDSLQAAMDGLIDTANVVDGVLGALSFVGVDYDPEVPMDEALTDVNIQLGELRDSLSGYSANLFSLTVTLNRLRDELTVVGDSLVGLQSQVDTTRELIAGYRVTAGDAESVITDASERLAGQVWIVRILGVALLLMLVPVFSALWWAGRSTSARADAGRLNSGQ